MSDGLGFGPGGGIVLPPFSSGLLRSMGAGTRRCGANAADPGPSPSLSPGPPARFPSVSDRGHGQPASEPPATKWQARSGPTDGRYRPRHRSVMRTRSLTGASPFGLRSTPDVRPLAIIRQNVWLDWIEAEQRAADPGLALPSDKRLAVSLGVAAARLLPGRAIWSDAGPAEATRQAGDQGCCGVDPTCHNPNTLPPATAVVSGPTIRLPEQHGKVRRDGTGEMQQWNNESR